LIDDIPNTKTTKLILSSINRSINFPKEKFKLQKLNDTLTDPLRAFNDKKTKENQKKLYKRLKRFYFKKYKIEKKYKHIRGKIEDFFKLCKSGLSLKKNTHTHTRYC